MIASSRKDKMDTLTSTSTMDALVFRKPNDVGLIIGHEPVGIDLTPLITHHFSLDRIGEAYRRFGGHEDSVLKVAIHP